LVLNRDSLLSIKNILSEFEIISGLCCNYDKTALLPINPISEQEQAWVTEAGFSIVDRIKLLGADICSDVERVVENFESIIEKIRSQILYWSRFKLSLPGRISTAKTFIMSQLNYLGCIFTPTEEQLSTCQELMNNFIRKNIKISDCRIYLPPEMGGLGFFNISEFLDAQRSTWLLRAKKNCIDNWRYDLHTLAPNHDPLLLRTSDVNQILHPVLHGIVSSYVKFHDAFSGYGKNYKQSVIFENQQFLDTDTGNKIDRRFFGHQTYLLSSAYIRSLSYDRCHNALGFKTLLDFRNEGLHLNLAQWMRLRNVCSNARRLAARRFTNVNACFRIDYFCRVWKKGGKKIRKFFSADREDKYDILNSRCFTTFCNLTNIDANNVPMTIIPSWACSWNTFSFTNDFKNFIFYLRYNQLPLNNRLSSYKSDVNPGCTFCILMNIVPAPRDSLSHCFLHCNTVGSWLDSLLSLTNFDLDRRTSQFKLLYWFGLYRPESMTTTRNVVFNLFFDTFKYIVFKNRLRKRIPNVESLIAEIKFTLFWVCKTNKKIKASCENTTELANFFQALG
jgi:hypothetical protein